MSDVIVSLPRLQDGTADRGALIRVAPVALLLCSIFIIAPEASFEIGDLLFPPYRTLIIVLLMFVAPRIIRGALRFGWPDLLFAISILWVFASFISHYGLSEGIVRAVAIAIDTAGSYLIARASIQTCNDLRRILILMVLPMSLAGLLMAFESITHQLIWRPLFMSLFGPLSAFAEGEAVGTLQLGIEIRLGLQRAFGPFSHPILGGIILVTPLPLYYLSGIRSWPRPLGMLVPLCGVFSVSSAAILALIVSIGSLALNHMLRLVKGVNWKGAVALLGLALLIVHFASKSGLINIVSRMTLTPGTAYYRQLIWEYGWQSMLDHPLIGIGYGVYDRPNWMSGSIDAHFLALGVRNGFITSVCHLAALLAVMAAVGRRSRRGPANDRNILVGMNLSLAILLIASMTVTFFSEANVWFMAFMGMGMALANVRSGSVQTAPKEATALPIQSSAPSSVQAA